MELSLAEISGSIRVFCRVRPSISANNFMTKSPVTVENEKIVVRAVGIKKEFSVDRVFDQESTQGILLLLTRSRH
jgi:kinesin family protein C2/C3